MALVLTIGRVADLFCEREIRVLQCAHNRRVDAYVECLQAIRIPRGIEQAVDGLGVRARAFRESQHGAIRIGDDARRVR